MGDNIPPGEIFDAATLERMLRDAATENRQRMVARHEARMALDDALRQALRAATARLLADGRSLADMREEDLRSGLYDELLGQLPKRVRKEKAVRLAAFQGVGPADLLIDGDDGIVALAETKWSIDSPGDKIFEAAWDAVKLALAQRQESTIIRGWLVVGAPVTAWQETECSDLFAAGSVGFPELWDRPLTVRRTNGGESVGEDCEIGGRGNVFTTAPARLLITPIEAAPLAKGTEAWEVRVVAVEGLPPWIEDFRPAPLFPPTITQAWLRANVPPMDAATFALLEVRLRQKRWTTAEIESRVYPLRGITG